MMVINNQVSLNLLIEIDNCTCLHYIFFVENNTQSLKNDVDVEKNKGNEENSEKVESGVKKESKKVPTFTENGWVLMPLKKKKKPLSCNEN